MNGIGHSVASYLEDLTPSAYLALVVVVAVGCQWLAWTLRTPALLLLLLVGFALGQLVRPDPRVRTRARPRRRVPAPQQPPAGSRRSTQKA